MNVKYVRDDDPGNAISKVLHKVLTLITLKVFTTNHVRVKQLSNILKESLKINKFSRNY